MASLFSMPRPRGRRNEPDNLLGLNGDIGMTDSSFQRMGRAPVNELWAGRNSAAVDDGAFDASTDRARQLINDLPEFYRGDKYTPEGGTADHAIRDRVLQSEGLHIYPGHVSGGNAQNPENIDFMQEFSDSGASLVDGWRGADARVLSDILVHDELYKNYPEIANLPVQVEDMGIHEGSREGFLRTHRDGSQLMGINSFRRYPDNRVLSAILHEAQHYIQGREGWGSGGAPKSRSARGILDYENIDGEILARDASRRHDYYEQQEKLHPDYKRQEDGLLHYPIRATNETNNRPSRGSTYEEIVRSIQ